MATTNRDTFRKAGEGSMRFRRIERGEGFLLVMCGHAVDHAPDLEQIERIFSETIEPDEDFSMVAVDGKGDSFLYFRDREIAAEFFRWGQPLDAKAAVPGGDAERLRTVLREQRETRSMLAYKSRAGGREYIEVPSRNSTVTCSTCGSLSGPTGLRKLAVRQWACSECGTLHDRDVNAAINALNVGAGIAL